MDLSYRKWWSDMLYFPLTKSLDQKVKAFRDSVKQHGYTEPHILVSVGQSFCSDYKCHPSITIMLISRSGDKIGDMDFLDFIDLSELNENESKELIEQHEKVIIKANHQYFPNTDSSLYEKATYDDYIQ